jgi:hypothetical protein
MSVLTLRPNSDSTPLQQVTSSGTVHYSLVDEETINTSDYCAAVGSSATNIQTDIYSFPNHSSETGTINSVTVKMQCKCQKGGTGVAYVNPAVKIGSTVYESGDQSITEYSTYALYSYTWTTNPATSSAWSWTEIDALLAGDKLSGIYKDKNNYGTALIYQLWVEVTYGEGGGGKSLLNSLLRKPFRHMLVR